VKLRTRTGVFVETQGFQIFAEGGPNATSAVGWCLHYADRLTMTGYAFELDSMESPVCLTVVPPRGSNAQRRQALVEALERDVRAHIEYGSAPIDPGL
jgi:hypothetical protein